MLYLFNEKKFLDIFDSFLIIISTALISCGGGGGGGPVSMDISGTASSTPSSSGTTTIAPVEIDASQLSQYLAEQEPNTPATPFYIKVTSLTTDNYTDIKPALIANRDKYVDLSTTILPSGITNLETCFYDCTTLTKAPVIPNGVTNMERCFDDCSALVQAPVIPNTVTNMYMCFDECSSLVQAPVIPNSVNNMVTCFLGCSALTNVRIEATNSTWGGCFAQCDKNILTIEVTEEIIKTTILQQDGTGYFIDENCFCIIQPAS
ncbi:MAG: leucine-rich repeat protein [Spirochaetaceae bacterium]|nr:leucine-rich repeat protein [Spirochaetaceae bacterium]